MRKAFVGMSGPVFFDFANSASRSAEDTASSPNPILDSPAALMLLYDEIWFLSRSLCPESMRELPFVKFVLEDADAVNALSGFSFDDSAHAEFIDDLNDYLNRRRFFDAYDDNLLALGASWWGQRGAAIDSHSHGLDLGKIGVSGFRSASVTDAGGVLFDQAILNHLGGDFELVTNSFLQEVIAPSSDPQAPTASLAEDRSLVDALTLSSLPNRLLKSGPDVHFLGELREDGCLPAFREWIGSQSSTVSTKELRDIEQEVTAAARKHLKNYYKKCDPKEFAMSMYKTVFVEGVALFLPPFGKAMKGAKAYREWQEVKSRRWSAFMFHTAEAIQKRREEAGSKAPANGFGGYPGANLF